MKDELRMCGACGKEHRWGIVKKDRQGVPLYGARTRRGCKNFLPVPLVGDQQVQVDAQAVVARIRSVSKGKAGINRVAIEWPHFMAAVFNEISDIRASFSNADSKFALLVSHTDEIVEAMHGVTQLSERLRMIQLQMKEIHERLDDIERNQRVGDDRLVDVEADDNDDGDEDADKDQD